MHADKSDSRLAYMCGVSDGLKRGIRKCIQYVVPLQGGKVTHSRPQEGKTLYESSSLVPSSHVKIDFQARPDGVSRDRTGALSVRNFIHTTSDFPWILSTYSDLFYDIPPNQPSQWLAALQDATATARTSPVRGENLLYAWLATRTRTNHPRPQVPLQQRCT